MFTLHVHLLVEVGNLCLIFFNLLDFHLTFMGHSTPLLLLQELHRAAPVCPNSAGETMASWLMEWCQVPACKGPWDHRAPKAVMGTGFGPPAWPSRQHASGGGDLEGTAEVRAEAQGCGHRGSSRSSGLLPRLVASHGIGFTLLGSSTRCP